jgi:hypothetical protein
LKGEKIGSPTRDYILIEERERTWANKSLTAATNRNSSAQAMHTGRSKAFKMLSTLINNPNSKGSGSQRSGSAKRRDMRVLQNHEKIMEAQDKWTGNGRFIIKNKSKFIVSSHPNFLCVLSLC